jgi:hypothetical protein
MTEDEQRNLQGVIDKLKTQNDAGTAAPPPPPQPSPPSRSDDFIAPAGIESMLEAHLGEALKIMRDFTAWIHHPKSDMEQCVQVSHAIGSLMTSSTGIAKLAVELRNGPAESRHRVIVDRAREGGGSAKAENE